jgi:GDP-L-fucose synthase
MNYIQTKVVITGGTGMVGNCIKTEINKDLNSNRIQYEFLSSKDVDLSNREAVLNYFKNKKYDYIIHLAANVGGLYKNMNGNAEIFSSNIKINENVLEACLKNDIGRGIFCLSSCIYPSKPSKFPMDETMIHEGPPHPSNEGYAYSKRMLEMQCRQYNEKYDTSFICVVPVNLYGPYDNFNLKDGHLLPMLMHRFHITRKYDEIVAYGTGKPLRQFLYAPDFAKIILRILFDTNVQGENIICCNNDEFTITTVVHNILDVMTMDKKNLKWLTEKADGCMKKTVSNKKLLTLYPDMKFTNFDDGLKETYDWFLNNYNNIRK